ncbi:MAG: hypothetical protein CL685_01645 [Candidatus Magasanikbacteria bacterium]|nr:hypothetical protein [Candidatus Magasanikbacteria bacterium]|tara:strand:- start:373 stop:1191 length:819 start_codon:yes stop_codon:yes gene_type:complete
MIIDVHTHIWDKSEWESFKKKSGGKIEKVISLPWCNNLRSGIPDVEKLLAFTETEPNIYAVGSIDIAGDMKKQLSRHEKLFQEGKIVGIKIYPGYRQFYPFDKRVVKIAQLCKKYNKPLLIHSGDLWNSEDNALLKYAHPIHVDELATICPETNIIICHFGFPFLMETALVLNKHKNVYTDISGIVDECGDSHNFIKIEKQLIYDLKRVFTYYPLKDKTLFGTDYVGENTPLNQVQSYFRIIKELMNKEEQRHTFYRLPEKLFFGGTNVPHI